VLKLKTNNVVATYRSRRQARWRLLWRAVDEGRAGWIGQSGCVDAIMHELVTPRLRRMKASAGHFRASAGRRRTWCAAPGSGGVTVDEVA
jgi:hypothetical protein